MTRMTTRIALAGLLAGTLAATAGAQEAPRRATVRLADRDPTRALADRASVQPATPGDADDEHDPATCPNCSGDPYGFVAILNGYRASAGLPPVAVDPNLSAWASQNNAAQCRRGLGHHVNPGCHQNSGWNYASAWEVAAGWMNSPGHRANMLSPSITRVGIAYGPGPYWTMNAQ
jgi:hypothetical protein